MIANKTLKASIYNVRQLNYHIHPGLIAGSRVVRQCCPRSDSKHRARSYRAPSWKSSTPHVSVDDTFDSGNGELISAEDLQNILVRIKPDPYTPHDQQRFLQNFCFRVAGGIRNQPIRVIIINAGQATSPEAYEACGKVHRSYDMQHWEAVPCTLDPEAGTLTLQDTPKSDVAYYAFWPPYQVSRGQDFIQRMAARHPDLVRVWVVGHSVQGRPLDVMVIGKEPVEGKKRVWLQARAHPGEPQSGYFLEGLVRGLLGEEGEPLLCARYGEGVQQQLLDNVVLYLAWNINPDGTAMGHMRTNALGANLNREWERPHAAYAPEVAALRDAVDALGGVSLFMDLHADWGAPHNWLFWPRWGIPGWTQQLDRAADKFDSSWLEVQPAFQTTVNYQPYREGLAPLHMSDNHISARYQVLAGTLEQPFTVCKEALSPDRAWGPPEALDLGASMLWPLLQVAPLLPDPKGPLLADPPKKRYTIGMVGLSSDADESC